MRALLLAEAVVFGRSGMGEAVEQGALSDRWRVRRDGRLIYAEAVRLDGAIAATLAAAGGRRRRRRGRDRADRAGRRGDGRRPCARCEDFRWRGRRVGLERLAVVRLVRCGRRGAAARSRRGVMTAVRGAAAAALVELTRRLP